MPSEIDNTEVQKRKIFNAKFYTNSTLMAADTINQLHGHGRNLDLSTLVDELRDSGKRITDGNMKEVERILIMQAKTLDYVFHDALSKLSDLNMINQIEVLANIALRAQAQSRKTLIALADIKHPKRTAFINNQINAIQVNNSESKNSKIFANKVVSEVQLENMDCERTLDTISINTGTETVGVFNRPENGSGQGKG
jgi:hypothetical protein